MASMKLSVLKSKEKNKKVCLIAMYDINSMAIRTLHNHLNKNNYDVTSIFFKAENPNNTMDKPKKEEIQKTG
tara:strand:- start:6444 stop:6659 length:216 start_codon:yes stop_codon:yes gene_type:complete